MTRCEILGARYGHSFWMRVPQTFKRASRRAEREYINRRWCTFRAFLTTFNQAALGWLPMVLEAQKYAEATSFDLAL